MGNIARNTAIVVSIAFVVGVCALIFVVVKMKTTPDAEYKPWENVHLRTYVQPQHYDIYYYPQFYHPTEFSFEGNETILVLVNKTTKYIMVHAMEINISSCRLIVPANTAGNKNDYEFEIEQNFTYPQNDYWVVETKIAIPAGIKLNVVLQFNGNLSRDLSGCYKGWFEDPTTNSTKYLISTKFEPSGARYSFPCFDEPSFKATFTMHLIHKRSHFALFNSKEISQKPSEISNDLVVTSFNQTPHPMSTYLVAWVVTESYSNLSEIIQPGNRSMRYFSPTHRLDEAKYALNVGSKLRTYFDNLLDFQSPLQKVDMISIPQFKAGAVENWGLITYKEDSLLYDEVGGTERDKFTVCRVIAHELAHTWFGNIVTMKWWDDVWLNEAFATYFAVPAVQNTTKWDAINILILHNRIGIMANEDDVNADIFPMIQNIKNRTEMMNNFNSFVYRKGGQILSWIREIMTRNNFIKGIQKYIKHFQYKAAVTKDVLQFLDNEITPEMQITNISNIMNPWLYQEGYPIIKVNYNVKDSSITAVQYSNLDISFNTSLKNNYKWNIPLTYSVDGNVSKHMPMMNKELGDQITFTIPTLSTTKFNWFLINPSSTGYYRVIYDSFLSNLIVKQIKNNVSSITAMQRAVVIDDAFELSYAGQISYDQSLLFISNLNMEIRYPVWKVLYQHLLYIEAMIADTSNFRQFMSLATQNIFLVHNGSSVNQGYFRESVEGLFIVLPCYYGNANCLNFAKSQFSDWLNGHSKSQLVSNYVYHLVLYNGLQQNDTSELWNSVYEKFKKNNQTFKVYEMVKILSATRNITNFRKVLWIVTSDYLDQFNELFSYICSRDKWAKEQVFDWLSEVCMESVMPPEFCRKQITKNVMVRVTYYFKTIAQKKKVEQFMNKFPTSRSEKSINRINVNIYWVKKYSQIVERNFKNMLVM